MRFHPDTAILKAPALDTLIIPGGEGLRRADVAEQDFRLATATRPKHPPAGVDLFYGCMVSLTPGYLMVVG